MTDGRFFATLSEQSPFQQGDIIKREVATVAGEAPEWGVIVTADCDIAQNKMGEFFTYLAIQTARGYLEEVWAPEQLSKLSARQARVAVEEIHKADCVRDPSAAQISVRELSEWCRADGPAAVVESVKIQNSTARKRVMTALEILQIVDKSDPEFANALQRLNACWTREGKGKSDQKSSIRNALSQRQMRSDCMMVPTLPKEPDVGFVVLLRDVRSIRPSDLFLSRLDRRINGDKESAMYRIGRFSDFIRYAIAQRMANLFSRIGMPEQFENDCEAAAGLTLEGLAFCPDATGDG